MTETPCPTCECWCCRDVSGMSVTHLAVRNSKHVCPDCGDGMVPAPVWTAEDERAAVVAWLRGEPERLVECNGHRHADGKPCWVMSPMPADELADAIERGDHHREEPTP